MKQIVLLMAMFFYLPLYCQVFEYKVENATSENSYYYTELRKFELSDKINPDDIIQNLTDNGTIEIRVLSSTNNSPLRCRVFFRGKDSDSTMVVEVDSNGYVYIPINKLPRRMEMVDFEIKTMRNGMYNGIEGRFDVYKTERLTIVLGKQGYETISIKSKSSLSAEELILLIGSFKKGVYPDKDSGISIEGYIRI